MRPDRDALLAFACRYTEAWCSQDPARVAACYSPGGSLKINDGEAAVGRAAIAESAKSFMSAFPDMRVTMDEVRVSGGLAFYHWSLDGSNTGPGGTGRRVRISGYEEWRMGEDGLIADSRGRFDAAEFERQLVEGHLPGLSNSS